MMQRIRRWWERMAWRPDEREAQGKDNRADHARREAIQARQVHETVSADVERRTGRVARLAEAYARDARRAAR